MILSGGALADTAGTGAFLIQGSVNFSGNIPSGQTVTVDGSTGSQVLNLTSTVTDSGTLALNATPNGFALIEGDALTIASGGVFSTSGGAGSAPAYLRASITNLAGGTMTIASSNGVQDSSTLTSNAGSFTVASGANLSLSNGSSFTQSGGTLALTGALSESSGTFTQTGGAESGHAVALTGGALADSVGTGAFDIQGGVNFSGNIPSGQTVTVDGSTGSQALNLTSTVTDSGTLALNATPNGFALIEGDALTVASGGVFSTSGGTGSAQAFIRVPLTNQAGGTVTLGAPNTTQDNGTLTTNSGSFTVTSTGNLAMSSSSSFTQSAGSLTVAGTLSESSGTFTQSGGTESGKAVTLSGGTLADSTGVGAFLIQGSVTLTGTIPAGQTVTVDGTNGSSNLTLGTPVTDNGSLISNATPNGYALVGGDALTVGSGGAFSTQGTAGASTAYIRVPITNQAGGTVTIGWSDTRQDAGTADTNAGTLQVVNGGQLILSSGSTLTNSSTGTLGVTVNGTSGTGGISNSGGDHPGRHPVGDHHRLPGRGLDVHPHLGRGDRHLLHPQLRVGLLCRVLSLGLGGADHHRPVHHGGGRRLLAPPGHPDRIGPRGHHRGGHQRDGHLLGHRQLG